MSGNITSLLIVYCGGTIGMRACDEGLQPDIDFADYLKTWLESAHVSDVDIVSMQPLIDSATAKPTDWLAIIRILWQYSEQYDGFIVLHGTDTLSYTAAALALWLEQLHKPIIITGAQRPMQEADSDGVDNICGAIHYARMPSFKQVGVYFGHCLLNPRATRKIHAQADTAFASPNADIWGRKIAGDYKLYSDAISAGVAIAPLAELFSLSALNTPAENHDNDDNHGVALCHLTPGMPDVVIKAMFADDVEAVVLLSYGVGNIASNPLLHTCLQSAIAQHKLIINCTQCLYGRTEQATYAAGITDTDVLEGGFASYEFAYVLSYFAVRLNLSQAEIKAQLATVNPS